MRGYMFRNRWFALLFVGFVLAGVTRLVGTSEDKGALEDATSRIAAQREAAERLTSTGEESEAADEVALEFTSDEELIDAATGEDPTPVDEFSAQQPAQAEEAQQPAQAEEETEIFLVPQASAETVEVVEQ